MYCFRKSFRAMFDNNVTPANVAREVRVEGWSILWVFAVLQFRDGGVSPGSPCSTGQNLN